MCSAQVEDAWIILKDKPLSNQYIEAPLTMLSQKALDRRFKQGISLDDTDVPIHQEYITTISNIPGISVLSQSKWMNALHVSGDIDVVSTLKSLSFVEKIAYANRSRNTQNKPKFSNRSVSKSKWDEEPLNISYGTSASQIEMLNGHLLHQAGYTGKGKTIAIIDTGFLGVDTASPFKRLRDNNQILGGYDFVNKSNDFYTSHDHGTSVLSCIAGYESGKLVGTAPDANFYLFITEDIANESPLEESLWVEAAERADSLGVDVINTSLGYTRFDNSAYDYTYQDMDGKTTFISRGLELAFSKGIFCVASAGNDGGNDWLYVATPADAVSALAVGAVDSSREYAYFSSIGPSPDGRVKPDVVAQGLGAYISDKNGDIGAYNGTSFSGPIIAGMVASLWEALPDMTNKQLMLKIKESAHLFSAPQSKLGFGIPDFNDILKNNLTIEKNEVFPGFFVSNPVWDVLKIESKGDANLDGAYILVFDVNGKVILKESINNTITSVNVSNLVSGLYVYRMHFKEGVVVNKFLKK